jgi:YesN/AraC family two-component response regulator
VSQFLGLIVSVGISRTFHRLSDASDAYASSQEALKYKFRLGEGSIVFIEDVQSESDSLYSFPEAELRELLDAIKLSDPEKARQHLDECIQSVAEKQIGYNHFQIMLAHLLSELLKEIWKTGEPFPALQEGQQSVFNQLFELKALQDIEQWFWQVIVAPFIEMQAHRRRHRYRKISEIMLEMIHEEFDTDLTLEACALRMNYHPNYIKRAFREETGSSFSDYLAQYRLNRAKQWMLETDMTISAIAEKLKYSNVQNFSRYFRKMEGISPSQYKALHTAAEVPR